MSIFKTIQNHFKSYTPMSLYLLITHKNKDYVISLRDEISTRNIYFCVYVNGAFNGGWRKGVDVEADFYKTISGKNYQSDIIYFWYKSPRAWIKHLKDNFKEEQIRIIELYEAEILLK